MNVSFIDPKLKEIAEFIFDNARLRAIFLDPDVEHTCHGVLVDLLMLYPYKDRPDVKRVFGILAETGQIPYYQSGQTDEGEALYRVRPEAVEELAAYFPPR